MIYARRLALMGLLIAVCGCAPEPVSPASSQNFSPLPAVVKSLPDSPAKQSVAKAETPAAPAKNDDEAPAPTTVAPRETATQPAAPFRFPETESGQLLASFLIPERQPLPPLAIPHSPKPGRRMLLETLGLEAYRTPLGVSTAPKGLLAQHAPRALSVPGEIPPLAAAGMPALPAPVTLPVAPRLYAPSPVAALPGAATTTAGVDPTAEAARGALLREPVAGRAAPAAPLPLELANPFQASRDAALRSPPAESPAGAGEGTRPRVNLPVPPAKQ